MSIPDKATAAIYAVAAIEIVALIMGHNGVILMTSLTIIGGLGGFTIGRRYKTGS